MCAILTWRLVASRVSMRQRGMTRFCLAKRQRCANYLRNILRQSAKPYLAHMLTAVGFGMQLISAGLACIIHGLFPFCFTQTGSSAVKRIHHEMIEARKP